ncbi:MAG: hypothetical protein AAFP84_20065 [Actinomycetota bacterium]
MITTVLVGAAIGAVAGLALWLSRRTRGGGERIDPFTVGEPWRQFVQGARRAADRLHSTVEATPSGPLKDRLTSIVGRLDHGVQETWRIARRGDEIDDAVNRLDPTALRSKLATLQAQHADAPSDQLATAIESVESQLATTDRLKERSPKTANTLRLAQTRLDELVTRAAEISVGAGDTDAYEHDVDDLVIELEALRQAIQEVQPG